MSPRPLLPARNIGNHFEIQALDYLADQGLKLVQKNFTIRTGEIDIIMLDRSTLVFIEVRYRTKNDYGSSIETVSFHKQNRIKKAALYFLGSHPEHSHRDCRFDVIGIDKNNSDLHIHWIKNAFTE